MIAVDVDRSRRGGLTGIPVQSRPSYVSLSDLDILLWCVQLHAFYFQSVSVLERLCIARFFLCVIESRYNLSAATLAFPHSC